MTRFSKAVATALVVAFSPWAGGANAADAGTEQARAARQAEREQIQGARRALEARRTQEEAACYRQFVVDSCLREVRGRARAQDNALREREVGLNDTERREKAVERMHSIEQREQEQRAKQLEGSASSGMKGTSRSADNKAQDRAQREQAAQQRAVQQKTRQEGRAAEQDRKAKEEPARIAESRTHYEAKQRAAQERRAKNEKKRADAAASGRPQAAPLPAHQPGSQP